ncbi:MAG: BA14K family protein [Agrobacterium vaccinii]
MQNYMKTLWAAGFAALTAAGSVVPAQAMPITINPPVVDKANDGVVNVQYWRDRGYGRDYGGGYYRGHRGYRDYRPGYRHHNGYWFPLAAFGAGAIIGGALAQPREVYRPVPEYRPRPVYREYRPTRRAGVSQSHVNWCFGRYRSYDAYSNTFQPYNGPRQTCYSPYG